MVHRQLLPHLASSMNKLPSTAWHSSSLSLLCGLSLSMASLQAQNTAPYPAPYGQNQGQDQQGYTPVRLSQENLDQLVAPIALYPDALTALMLPAATTPSDIVLAERYLTAGGDPAQTDTQSWDDSVKGLLHYPDVLSWMDQNLDWTTSLGEAFATQPDDVMNAIQYLRAQALAAGNLVDTPQQKVIAEDHDIRIFPADPQIIYVPVYDPDVVYLQPASSDYGSMVTFGVGCAVGAWLSYDFDWGHRGFYHGNWNGGHHHAGNQGGNNTAVANVVTISHTGATAWQPSAVSLRQISQRQHNIGGNARIATVVSVQTGGSSQIAPHHSGVIPHPTGVHLSGGTPPARKTGVGTTAPATATPIPPTAPTQHFQQQPTAPQFSQNQQQQTQQIQHPQRQTAPELQHQQSEPIHQQAVPAHHDAPPTESHPRQNAPQVIQAPKVDPPQQHIAPTHATSAEEPKEHKKGEDKDRDKKTSQQ